ncbi:hypothetical protein N7491_006963 [Penicillium cf. griseofulvum]|nr:hypothetical protein N7491_006963 [Penicillium cf. griseofulvum]KAJ5436278.1 hypothetical protein N7445_007163 [Penicillium cf. griseofulvum]
MSKEEHCKLTVSCEDGRAIGTDKSPDSSRLHCEEANSHIPGNSGPVLLPQLSYISASVREIIQIDFLAALPPSYPSNFSVTSTQPPCVEQRKFLPAGEPSPMMMWCGTECASSISHNTLIQGVLRDAGDDVTVPPTVSTEDDKKKFGEICEVKPYLRFNIFKE